MSVHCCNKYCDIDEEFHRLQKDLLGYNGDMSNEDAYYWLLEKFSDMPEFLKKLTPPNNQ